MKAVLGRLAWLLRRDQKEAELREELEFHLAEDQEEAQAAGLTAKEAAFAARRAFGSVALAEDRARDIWPWAGLREFSRDLRFGFRLLTKDRAFTAVAVLTLGIGIGVDNAVFMLVNAACLRALPIERVDRVLFLNTRDARERELGLSHREFDAARSEAPSFAALAAFVNAPIAVSEEGRAPERVVGTYLSAGGFGILRERPILGRDFESGDDQPGAPAVVILGSELWKSRYVGDPSIVGRTIRINRVPATVIGIMAEGFKFPSNTQVWQPLGQMNGATDGLSRPLSVFGRLQDDTPVAQARDEVAALGMRLSHDYPDSNQGIRLTAMPITERYLGDVTDQNFMVMLVIGVVVVLIACANVANLLLMRAIHRAHEMATRASLGATRGHLLRQLFAESVLLATMGGVLGLVLSLVSVRLVLSTLIPPNTLPYWLTFTMDARAFTVLCVVCLGTVFVFGLAPAFHLAKADIGQLLKSGGRLGTRPSTRRWTSAFLIGEIGLTMMFLASLVAAERALRAGVRADTVIDPTSVITTWVTLAPDKYPTPATRADFYGQLDQRLKQLPSISASAVTTALPRGGALARQLAVDGAPVAPGITPPTVWALTVSPQYFEALGLGIQRGRGFDERDGTTGSERAIVNQRFVQMYSPDANPVGRRIRLADPNRPDPTTAWLTIVGVSPTVRQRPSWDPDPIVYLPLQAAPPPTAVVLVRGGISPAELRDAVRGIDADLPLYRLMSLEQALREANWAGRVSVALSTTIVWIAIGMAAVGLYAVTAHVVAQRTREIGIRIALGARRPDMVRLVMRRVVSQVALGILAGVLVTSAWARVFAATSNAYTMSDPISLVGASILFSVVAGLACILPIWRATHIDPVLAIRDE